MITLNQGILFFLLASCFISFSWSLLYFFIDKTDKSYIMMSIKVFGFLFTLLQIVIIFLTKISTTTTIIASVFYIVSFLLFWWCIRINKNKPLTLAFSKDEPHHLVCEGPYRYVRHPFYLSYTIFWIAGCIATLNIILFLSIPIMLFLYYLAASMEEKKFLASPLAESYINYKKNTGMFFINPKILWQK